MLQNRFEVIFRLEIAPNTPRSKIICSLNIKFCETRIDKKSYLENYFFSYQNWFACIVNLYQNKTIMLMWNQILQKKCFCWKSNTFCRLNKL